MQEKRWPALFEEVSADDMNHHLAPTEILWRFEKRWGAITLETLRQALKEPHPLFDEQWDEERQERYWVDRGCRLFAIFTLGRLAPDDLEDVLTPLLSSVIEPERWIAAIALGRHRFAPAFPLLLRYLIEENVDYPYEEEHDEDWWYQWEVDYEWYLHLRQLIVAVLGDWGRPEAIPALRQVLAHCWRMEQLPGPYEGRWGYLRNSWWHRYADLLAYTLGRLGASESFSDLDAPPDHRLIAIMLQVFGALGVLLPNPSDDIYSCFQQISPSSFDRLLLTKREIERIEQIVQAYQAYNDTWISWEQIVQKVDRMLWARLGFPTHIFIDPVPVSQILGARFGFSEEAQRQAIDDFPLFFTKRAHEEPELEAQDVGDLLSGLDEHPFGP